MATTAESGSGSSEVLRSERIAAGILPKVLNSFDMVAIFVAAAHHAIKFLRPWGFPSPNGGTHGFHSR